MIRTTLSVFLMAIAISSGTTSLRATESDPLLVGILATAVEPETARQLELTEDQLTRLAAVIKDRESRGLALGQAIRELPPSERDAQQRQFVRESEKAGFALLNAQQKSRLQQMRLAKLGMLSLLDEEVAETLGLSDGQKEQIQKVADSRSEMIREVGRSKVGAEMELRLKSVLTLTQYATWQAMAGVSARSKPAEDQASSVAGATEVQAGAEASESVASTSDGSSKAESVADDTAKKPLIELSQLADQEQMTDLDGASRDLLLNFKETPWESVLKWICEQADLTLMTNTYPIGTFTYADRYRKYSVAEAMDVMNGVLLRDGYSLIRKGRGLMILDLGESNAEKADLIRQYVREMSQLVTPEDLDNRGEFELCKCLFFLGRLSASEAKKVVEDLLGPQGSVLAFEPAAQILVTETGGKLRLIRTMLKRIEDPTSSPGSKVVSIGLKHVTAEEVLAVARPLLSLQEGVNTSADINLSTDTFGNTIFATGKADKLQTLKDVAEKVDVDPGDSNSIAANGEKLVLRSHSVRGSDPETTFDIVQTMLAGIPSVRVTMDKLTNNIIAFCLPSDHDLIQKTLDEIAGRKSNFTIIPLKRIDPQAAILTLEKFFGKKSGSDKDASKGPIFYGDTTARTLMVQGTEDEVRQVNELISKLESSGPQGSSFGDRYGFVPVSGRSADRLLDSMGLMWSQNEKRNPIKVYSTKGNEGRTDRRTPPSDKEMSERARKREEASKPKAKDENGDKSKPAEVKPAEAKPAEAKPAEAKPAEAKPAEAKPAEAKNSQQASSAIQVGSMASGSIGFLDNILKQLSEVAVQQLLLAVLHQPPTGGTQDEKDVDEALQQQVPAGQEPIMVIPGSDSKAEIVIYRSPTGLIVTSSDKQALAEFQEMARMLSDQMALGNAEPAVIYLRYIKAQAAEELLKEILSGESNSGGGGGLLGNMVGELGGGLIGGLLGGGRSTSTSSSSASSEGGLAQGEYSIISDPRLNALIVKAAPMDMDLIEKLIDVIDQEDSPVDIETRGVPRIIPVENGDVDTIANIVKESFKDRIAGADAGAAQRPPSPQELIQALRGGGGGGRNGGQSQKKESMMSIATDAKTNSLIVTSTLQLYEQVYDLVKVLDAASAENEEIISPIILPGNVNPVVIQNALQSTFGAQIRTNQMQQQQANNQRNNQQNTNRGQPGQGFQFPQGMQGMNFQFPQGGNRTGGQGGNFGNQGGNFGNRGAFGNFGPQGFGGQGNQGNRGNTQNRGNNNNNRTGGQRNR